MVRGALTDATERFGRILVAATDANAQEGRFGVPADWMLAAHVVVGWPGGRRGPVRRRPLAQVVFRDHWDEPAGRLTGAAP